MFSKLKSLVQSQFKEMSHHTLYEAAIDKDTIWNTYLSAFPEHEKQSNNCNCCKSFLRQFGGIVVIKDNEVTTLWDINTEGLEEYTEPVKALAAYVRSCVIDTVFLNTYANIGTDKNLSSKTNTIWQHFYLTLPGTSICDGKAIGYRRGQFRDNKNVLERGLKEIKVDAAEAVLELINQNSLYRGAEFKPMVSEFLKIKQNYDKVKKNTQKTNFCWTQSAVAGPAISRINNSAIGTLLKDLSEGKDLDEAVRAFERIVAPANYKRPTSLVTPRMIEAAKKQIQELGLTEALNRRVLTDTDLNVNNALFVHRVSNNPLDVFDTIKKETLVNPKSLSKVEEVNITDFLNKVVPTAKSISVLLENSHFGNFVTLVGAKELTEKTLFKWNNNFSWSYTGGVTDSIKERVKQAGGKVDGVLRISLSWGNYDDLDLHLIEPKGEIYFANKRSGYSSGILDVDENAGSGRTRTPVENIAFSKQPPVGHYRVVVHNFNRREQADTGFEVEIEYQGETQTYTVSSNGPLKREHDIVEFDVKSDGSIVFSANGSTGKYTSREKWGLKSGQLHKVKAITLSPNHWKTNVGNKHFFFLLEGCESDEKPRPFYNEFLKEELSKDRKVFEVLGAKIEVEKTKNELSGIGFSETQRNHLFVMVEGAIKRTLKVIF